MVTDTNSDTGLNSNKLKAAQDGYNVGVVYNVSIGRQEANCLVRMSI